MFVICLATANQQQVGIDAITQRQTLHTMSSIILKNTLAAPYMGYFGDFIFIFFPPTNLPFHFNVKQCFVSRVNFAESIHKNWSGVLLCFIVLVFAAVDTMLPHALLMTSSRRSYPMEMLVSIISK